MDRIVTRLVRRLARGRWLLATTQEEVERLIGKCDTLEIKCEALEHKIETAALEGTSAMPHPAVVVLRPVPYLTIPYESRVRIDADLSKYLEKIE